MFFFKNFFFPSKIVVLTEPNAIKIKKKTFWDFFENRTASCGGGARPAPPVRGGGAKCPLIFCFPRL